MATQNQTLVTEEQKEARFLELNAKKDRSEDENKELGELKTNYANTAKDRIGKLSGKNKQLETEKAEEKKLREAAEQREKDLQTKLDASAPAETIVGNENETVDVDGKKYFTDAALSAQIKSGKITEQAAIEYQAKRNRTDIVVAVREDLKKERVTENAQNLRTADADKVLKEYPQFSKEHADFNANDPLYKTVIELYNDGLGLKPDGLSKSVKRAKQILGIKDTPVDRSSELSVEEGGAPIEGGKEKEQEVTLTENEEDAAVSQFCQGDVPNPKTGRPYTRDEAIAAAKEAKKARRK